MFRLPPKRVIETIKSRQFSNLSTKKVWESHQCWEEDFHVGAVVTVVALGEYEVDTEASRMVRVSASAGGGRSFESWLRCDLHDVS